MNPLISTNVVKVAKSRSLIDITMGKPDGYSFVAGQHLNLHLNNTPSEIARRNKHTFSIATSPKSDFLRIVTRVSDSDFKISLMDLQLGDELFITEASGTFTLNGLAERNVVFIAGGIGITPIFSMLHDSGSLHTKLLWSNKGSSDAPLFDEIMLLSKQKEDLIVTFFDTMENRINQDAFNNIELDDTRFFLSGTPGFVTDMQSLLVSLGVDYLSITTDSFGGY